MSTHSPLNLAVAGLGRMGVIHALHVLELERETGTCRLAALVDSDTARAKQWAADNQVNALCDGYTAVLTSRVYRPND